MSASAGCADLWNRRVAPRDTRRGADSCVCDGEMRRAVRRDVLEWQYAHASTDQR